MWKFLEEEAKSFADFPCDVIVVAGQSNADGVGMGGEEGKRLDEGYFIRPVYRREPQPGRRAETEFLGDNTVSKCSDRINETLYRSNMLSGFAPLYVANDLARGRKLIGLVVAVGGTGFTGTGKEWGLKGSLNYDKLLELTDSVLALNPGNELKALLWHQGEDEVVCHNEWNDDELKVNHTDILARMFADYRSRYGNMPIMAGGFTERWSAEHPTRSAVVMDAIAHALDRVGNAKYISSKGVQINDEAIGNGDTIHFSRDGQIEFGRRYYAAYKELTSPAK